jgi:hypothetical protein
MSYLSLVYGGGVVLSSAAAVGATYLGNMLNPVVVPKKDISIAEAFGGGEKGELALEILKYDSTTYSADELLDKMEKSGLDINELASCSEQNRLVCGLLVKKITDIINRTANPSKFLGLGDQTQEATEMIESSRKLGS